MNDTELLVRSVLVEYGAQEATEEIMTIFNSTNRKKLRPAQVRELRMQYRAGKSQSELADQFHLNPATVSRIVRGIYF